MRDLFGQSIERLGLIGSTQTILVGVSGGVDSMSLLHLLVDHVGGRRVVAAHCNFSLRGGESDAEQALVERCCAGLGVECHTVRFATKQECQLTGESTQMAARRLRYDWFDSLSEQYGYRWIAIAHHADDSTETFFINLMRGTGLRGLTGIAGVRGRIIRPLLFASRWQIESYAAQQGVEYMHDSSNFSDNYLRGRLRNDIIPRMQSASASFAAVMGGNMERLAAAQQFVDSTVARIGESIFVDQTLDMVRLAQFEQPHFLLYELLRPYGFSAEVVDDILMATHTGKRFHSARYVATLNRRELIVGLRDREPFIERTISADSLCVEWVDPTTLASVDTAANVALLSADALQFPLYLRRWQSGDWFIPFGMQSQKKVSDFLIDSKLSLPDKEQQGVLVSGQTIVWLVGRRIDDRYRVEESTQRVVRITL